MLSDRRVITEKEIFMLINWKLERFCIENKTDTMKILLLQLLTVAVDMVIDYINKENNNK